MDLCFITPMALQEHPLEEIAELLERDGGYVWLDVPEWTPAASRLLTRVFGFHPAAIEICRSHNQLPMVHGYSDYVFLALHRPFVIDGGPAHPVELDLFVGDRFLVTVHGPVDPSVPPAVPMDEVRETLDRIRARQIWPDSPTALMHALVSQIARRQRIAVQDLATRVTAVESRVRAGGRPDPLSAVDEMFLVRQELLTLAAMASLGREVLGRARRLLSKVTAADLDLVADLEDGLERVERMAGRERDRLDGVIEHYRTRTDTRALIVLDRLAALALGILLVAIGDLLRRWAGRRRRQP
jgi:magnesium transporter